MFYYWGGVYTISCKSHSNDADPLDVGMYTGGKQVLDTDTIPVSIRSGAVEPLVEFSCKSENYPVEDEGGRPFWLEKVIYGRQGENEEKSLEIKREDYKNNKYTVSLPVKALSADGTYQFKMDFKADSGASCSRKFFLKVTMSKISLGGGDEGMIKTDIGENAEISVKGVDTDAKPTYKWEKDGAELPEQTGPTLTFNPVKEDDFGDYTVTVTYPDGTTETDKVTISPKNPPVKPVVSIKATNKSPGIGDSITLTATVDNETACNRLSYQWYKGAVGEENKVGKDDNTYLLKVGEKDFGIYYCVVTNTLWILTEQSTSEIKITQQGVAEEPEVTVNKTSVVDDIGNELQLRVSASVSDDGTLSYQWFKGDPDKGQEIDGANKDAYIKTISKEDEGKYYCVVTNSLADPTSKSTSKTSDEILVSLHKPEKPKGVRISAPSTSYKKGKDVPLTVNIENKDTCKALSYQWYRNSAVEGNEITGAIDALYTIRDIGNGNDAFGTTYYCIVTNTRNEMSESATSESISITEKPAIDGETPVFIHSEENAHIAMGAKLTLTVSVSVNDGGTLSCKWYKGTVEDGGTLLKSTENGNSTLNDSCTIEKVESSSFGKYYCVVTNTPSDSDGKPGIGTKYFTINELLKPAVTIAVNDTLNDNTIIIEDAVFLSAGNALTLAAAVDDIRKYETLSYQWYKDGNPIAGEDAKKSTYSVASGDIFGEYYCIVTHSCKSKPENKNPSEPSNTIKVKNLANIGDDVDTNLSLKDVKLTYAKANEAFKLEAQFTYKTTALPFVDVSDKAVWSSVDPSIVTVEKGTLDTKKAGETGITARYKEKSLSANVLVMHKKFYLDTTNWTSGTGSNFIAYFFSNSSTYTAKLHGSQEDIDGKSKAIKMTPTTQGGKIYSCDTPDDGYYRWVGFIRNNASDNSINWGKGTTDTQTVDIDLTGKVALPAGKPDGISKSTGGDTFKTKDTFKGQGIYGELGGGNVYTVENTSSENVSALKVSVHGVPTIE